MQWKFIVLYNKCMFLSLDSTAINYANLLLVIRVPFGYTVIGLTLCTLCTPENTLGTKCELIIHIS